MAIEITHAELRAYGLDITDETAELFIRDAVAMAVTIAPGLKTADQDTQDAAAGVIRGAIVRWGEAGAGGVASQSKTMGPFSTQESYRQRSSMFFPSEEALLKRLADSASRRVYSVDMLPDEARGPYRDWPSTWPEEYLLGPYSTGWA